MANRKFLLPVELPADATSAMQAVTKQQMDAAAAGAVQTTRQVIAGTGLTGGGTLAADRTLTVAYGSTTGTAVQGNDTRVVADQAAGTASIRTLGTGAAQASAGTHTHSTYLTQTDTDALYQTLAAAVPVAPRTGSASTTVSIDGAVAGDYDLTCTGNTAITLTGTPTNGRTFVITCLASGGARTPAVAAGVALTTGVGARSLAIPSGGLGVFVLRYSTLAASASWHLASAYLVT